MSLKPEISIGVGLAVATVVYGIYQTSMPPVTDVRVAPSQDMHINASRNTSAWTAAAVVAGVSLIAKDPTVFTIGGAMVIALDWWYRHANAVHPSTGRVMSPSAPAMTTPGGGDLTPGYTDSSVA